MNAFETFDGVIAGMFESAKVQVQQRALPAPANSNLRLTSGKK
ncbi:MAG: hypothetical protein WAL34_04300 [Acidobacteriaceae bacterium]